MIHFLIKNRLEALLDVVCGIEQLTIVLHNNPDPDAIAAGAALQYLLAEKAGLQTEIVYQGVIGRAENKAFVDYLDVPLIKLSEDDDTLRLSQNLALVDTHPQSKNNPIPAGKTPLIVIDHHNNYLNGKAGYSDVRPSIGATATIMTQYLEAAHCPPPERLATALLYGIKTDTMALSRNTTTADVNAYCYLSALADIDVFQSFEKAQVPAGYFQGLAAAMTGARVYENGLIIAYLKDLPYPDLVAEIADLLLRFEGSKYILSMGTFEETFHFSIRTIDELVDVNKLAQVAAGSGGSAGGREMIAGGQIPLNNDDPEDKVEQLKQRILEYFKLPADAEGEPLA